MCSRTERTHDDAMRTPGRTTMTRPRTKRIDGYQIQPLLPMHFPYFGGLVEEADFTTYPDTGACVEVSMRIGLIQNPYTLVLSIAQALDADIIERV
jgi:hypothetical protein